MSGNVGRLEEKNADNFQSENLEGRDFWEVHLEVGR